MVIRERTFCLLIKKGEEELESTKFGKFVKVIAIGGTNPEQPPILVKDVDSDDVVRCNIDQLIPLAENCVEEQLQDILRKKNYQIIKSLAIMIHDLRKEVESLKSQTQWLAEFKKTRGSG